MGIVYRARHRTLPRMAALKMMLVESGATAEHLARFRKDADSLAQMEHEHIVRVYDYDEDPSCGPYFALEYVEGGSLAARLKKESRWEFRRAARLIETLARATHFAHENNIVHRDLKPGNVLLAQRPAGEGGLDFVPKITDFGLAKTCLAPGSSTTAATAENLTHVGAVMGTPSYMAPEQSLGRIDVDRRVDVYALGALLYELLTGRPPFVGNAGEVLLQVQNYWTPPPVRPFRADVPEHLEAICLKCLQRDPADRYATAGELADALRAWLATAPPSAGSWPPGRPAPPRPWAARLAEPLRRHPVRWALLALAGVLFFVGGFVGYRLGPGRGPAPLQARPPEDAAAQRKAEKAKKHIDQAESALKEQDRLAANSHFDAAQDLYRLLADSDAGHAEYRLKVAEMLNRKASILCELRQWKEAERTFGAALDELAPLAQTNETRDSRRQRELQEAEAYHGLGVIYNDRDDTPGGYPALKANWEKARQNFVESLDRRKSLRREAAKDDKDLPLIERDRARSYGYLGDLYLKLGKGPVAKEVYANAKEIRRRLAEQAPDDLDAQMQLARSYANSGYCAIRLEEPGAVEHFLTARKHLSDRMDKYGAAHNPPPEFRPDCASYSDMAASLLMDDAGADRGNVLPLLNEARDIYEQPAKDHPTDPTLVSGLAQTYLLLGRYHLASDRQEARKYLALADELLADSPVRRGPADLVNRALIRALQARLTDDEGQRVLVEQAVEFLQRAHRAGYNNLGELRRLNNVPEFQPLTKSDDFRKFIAGLEAQLKQ
jgi:tetratricopeptide (TPR) repeat protein